MILNGRFCGNFYNFVGSYNSVMCFFKSCVKSGIRLIMPVLVLLLSVQAVAAKDFVVTLDAGHGGHDYGAIGEATNEKTLTLAVVKKLGDLIDRNLKDVKVVYTRDHDVFIPLSERAAIANKAASDLFISVHINSVDKRNKNRRNIEGCQVYTLGLHKTAENLAVAKRENSVMELEADHTEKYAGFDPNSLESDIVFELSQNKRLDQSIEFADPVHDRLSKIAGRAPKAVRQAGFWVLWATSMPSVLVELDFICNPRSEKYMASADGQEEMVTALYNAFCAYLNTYGSQVTGRNLPVACAITPKGKKSKDEAVRLASPVAAPEVVYTEPAPVKEGNSKSKRKSRLASTNIPEISDNSGEPKYYVQILASGDVLRGNSPELKKAENVEYYRDGGMYKYAVGVAENVDEAKKILKKARKDFPQCFIIKMINGKRVDFIKP